jgi:DNA-binding transcriptional regulator YbjK
VPATTPRGEARREAIVDAAAGLLLTGGVTAVAHRPVAAAAGVPLGSTTYYFRDREDLVAAAVQRSGEIEAARARAALERSRPRPGRPARGARAAARRLVDVVVGLDRCGDPALVGALYERIVEAARVPAARAAAWSWNDAIRAVVADLLADEGLTLPPDVLLALVDGSVVAWLLDEGVGADALVSRVATALALLRPPT